MAPITLAKTLEIKKVLEVVKVLTVHINLGASWRGFSEIWGELQFPGSAILGLQHHYFLLYKDWVYLLLFIILF